MHKKRSQFANAHAALEELLVAPKLSGLELHGRTVVERMAPSGRLLTTREVAELLRISERTVRRLVAAGRLPCVRIGRTARVDPVDVSRFVAARKE